MPPSGERPCVNAVRLDVERTASDPGKSTRTISRGWAKAGSPNPVIGGATITYTLTVTNNGPSEAPTGSVTVSDPVPANTTIVGSPDVSLAPGFTCSSTVSCSNASAPMAPGAKVIIRFTVQVVPGFGTGAINNVATVSATQGQTNLDPNTNNNTASETTSVGPFADLQLTKTVAQPSAVAGGPAPGSGVLTYTINYRNNGPSDALGVQITDTIPANLASIVGSTITAAGLSCNGATPQPGTQLVCVPNAGAFGANAAGVLPNGASGTITFSVRVPANVAQGTLVTNGALIASIGSAGIPATPDPNTANNSQNPTSTVINAIADLQIAKTQSAATITAGGASINYTLAVTNNGSSDAQNVVVNDSLPAGLEFLAVSQTVGSGFTCTNPTIGQNGVVSCSKGVMAAGETATFVITVRAPATAAAAVRTNTATVQSATTDNGPGANSSSVQTTIVTDANVTITKIDNPDPVVAGENLTYTITVTNSGPSIARSVTVTDPIPANTTFVSMAGTGILGNCTLTAGTISCTPENLGVNESATLTVVVKVSPSAPASVSNTATVTWTDSDSTPGTATSTTTTTVNRRTDLTIKKSDSPQAVLSGNNIVYTIKVRNNGPSQAAAGSVIVKDGTPANTTDVSLTGGAPFAGCTLAQLHGAGCANASAMNPGDEATLTYTVQVVPGTPTGFITNTATVEASPSTNDPNTTNNASTTQTAVGPFADLQLTKTATPPSVLAGGAAPGNGQINYTITYRNDGPSDAIGVSLTDTVSANLMAIPGSTITATGLSCNGWSPVPGVQFSCTPQAGAFGSNAAGVLPVGASGTITYSVKVPANVSQGTLIANAALITSLGNGSTPATPDPNTANNSQNATSTLVNTSADLTITKTDSPDPVIAGNNLTYTITVANAAGPSDAQNVVITDTIPSQTTFVSVASSDASVSCTAPPVGASGLVTCNKATLPVGATVTLTLTVKVKPNTPSGASISNTATVGSQTPDPTPNSNTATTTTAVTTEATLSVVKTDSPDPVVAGTNLTYSITVTNNGPSDAQNVTLSDPLPAQTSYVSLSGTGIFGTAGACSHNGGTPGTVSCGGGLVLPAGQSATLNIVVKVAPSAQVAPPNPPITNTVSVSSPTDAGSPRTASTTTNVRREADMELTKSAPATVIAGNNIDYTLKVKNIGPSDVDGGSQPGTITVVDTLPFGVTPLSPMSSPNVTISGPGGFTCSYDSGTGKVTCVNAAGDAGDFPAGSIVTIIFKARVSSSLAANTNINNCATVSLTGLEVDPVGGNNSSCASTVIQTSADLGAGKTAPQQGVAGQNITYNITFGNAGPSDAVNVRITDNIPANTTYQTPASPFTVLAVGGVYTGGNSVKLECTVTGGNTLTCTPKGNTGLTPSLADGVLPAGVTGAFSYDVKINASVTGGTILANGVNITSAPSGSTPGTPDPNTGNNTSLNTSTVVIAQSQLVVTKAVQTATFAQSPPAPAGAVVPGTNLTYRISVTNNGPSDVNNVQVADTLPSNVTYVSAVPAIGSGFTCLPANGGVVTCNSPLLPNGVTRTIDVTVFIDPATKVDLVNKADASGISNGFNQVLNAPTFTLTTPVGPTSDLVLTKTHAPEPVIAGNNLVYTLTLRNNGPSTAAMVNLVDTLPTFQSLAAPADVSAAPGFSCTPNTVGAAGAITCSAASLAPNAQVVIKLAVKVDPSASAGIYNNVATAASMSFDPTPASVTDPVTVITRADLSITKSAPATVVAGTQMTYTINATNNGPSSAANMKINDVLPTGVVFISASAPGSSTLVTPAVNANGTITATWAGLTLPGVTRSLTIVVRVCSEVACDTNINNTATTSSDTQDDNPANNSATATTKVQAQWDLSIAKAGPATTTPDASFAYTLTVTNAGPSVATNVVVTDVMPKGFFVVGTPTATISGAVVTVTTNSTTGQQTVTADLKSVGADNQCSTNLPKTVTITINVKVAKTMPFITVTNAASVASSANCSGGSQGDQNAANNATTLTTKVVNGGPEVGREYLADAEVSDQKAGSVLFFPIYTSDAASPNRENTRISITNTNTMERACIHLFGVDGASCSVADAFVCLTPNQTTTFLASDLDPGNRGYFVAVAVDCETGLPKAFNFLIGDSFVKFSTGHQANLAAESVAATMWYPAGANPNQRTATLNFDGMSYNRLPAILSLDNIQSPVDGNNTMLIVDRIGGDLTNAGANIGPLFGFLYNDQEVGYSFTANVGACQLRQTLSNSFPRTLTPFSSVIPAGRTGWMKFWSNNEYGIFGSMINFNPNAASSSGAFNQGHNLHKLTLAPSTSLTIPVVVPFC